jgi:hypothetical protein
VIKDNSIQYTIDGTNYTENPNFTNLYQATYNVRARISNGAYCSAISTLGSATIAPPPGTVAITGQPDTTTRSIKLNAAATTLSVTATGADTLRYQWYSNTTANINGGPILGATSASYTPATSAIGTLYYYCIVSNACSEVRSALSGSVTIYLPAPNISYNTPNTFNVGTLISPLTPTNTGGNPVGVLNNVSTLAGCGAYGCSAAGCSCTSGCCCNAGCGRSVAGCFQCSANNTTHVNNVLHVFTFPRVLSSATLLE